MPLVPFEVNVESDELAVRDALGHFLEALKPLQLNTEETSTVELVLAEVLNNIVEHAYPASAPSGPIALSCVHKPDGLYVEIKDQGRTMPDGKMPIGQLSSLDVDMEDLPEGGFGWFLIKNLAKDVTYERVGKENRLQLRLLVGVLH
ncbi:MAG: ATP-binding protein [Roseobacter sp.]